MDGLCRALGCPTEAKLCSREYTVLPLTLARLGRCEHRMLKARQLPLQAVLAQAGRIPMPTRERLIRKAWDATYGNKRANKVSDGELFAWLGTTEGLIYSARLCLRDWRGKIVDPLKIDGLFVNATTEEIGDYITAREMASGLGLMAQLDWRFSSGEDDGSLYPWRVLLRDFARTSPEKTMLGMGQSPGWTAKAVGDLTLYQLRVYTCEQSQVQINAEMTPEAALQYQEKLANEKIKRQESLSQLVNHFCH